MTFEETLAEWIPSQRWFAGKGARILDVAIVADTELAGGDPGLRHLILAVSQGGRRVDTYQLFLGLRAELPDELRHVLIGRAEDGRLAYDALHDPELTRWLLRAIAGDAEAGPLRFRREPGADLDTELDSLVLTGEQSNTSLIFGEESILKVFRRPSPGINPDLEVNRALAQLGSTHIASRWAGSRARWAAPRSCWASCPATCAPPPTAGHWRRPASVTCTPARPRSRPTRAATSPVRRTGSARLPPRYTATWSGRSAAKNCPRIRSAALADDMFHRLDEAIAAVPELGQHADLLGAAFSDLAKLDGSLAVQRVHGDYHLGQVLRTQTGWVVLDFEGEPATPLALRRAPASALRDVAGMLRSFDYAARHQLLAHLDEDWLHAAAVDWVRRNQDAFCAGYAAAGGTDPGTHAILLRALVLDKAVYEVMYEARHRPGWIAIPLGSIADA